MSPPLDIGALYAEHGPFVARVLERLTGNGPHVDDLLQECFVSAFKSRDKYNENRASLTTWLYSIAANISKRHHRSRWRFGRLRERVQTLDAPPSAPLPDDDLVRDERARLVHEAMQKLPFKQREVFSLYELEGLDGTAISQMLGVPEGTVWTRLHHARKGFAKLVRQRFSREDRS